MPQPRNDSVRVKKQNETDVPQANSFGANEAGLAAFVNAASCGVLREEKRRREDILTRDVGPDENRAATSPLYEWPRVPDAPWGFVVMTALGYADGGEVLLGRSPAAGSRRSTCPSFGTIRVTRSLSGRAISTCSRRNRPMQAPRCRRMSSACIPARPRAKRWLASKGSSRSDARQRRTVRAIAAAKHLFWTPSCGELVLSSFHTQLVADGCGQTAAANEYPRENCVRSARDGRKPRTRAS